MTDKDTLIQFVSDVSGDDHLKVEEDFGDGFVKLRVSEAERRQAEHDIRGVEDVVIELLRNSRDARAKRIYVASSREGSDRTITLLDDGVGVPAHLHERIFDPRVTSKLETMSTDRWGVHGRGMALFSVKSNVTSARVVSSDAHRGMAIVITADVDELPERADQSTWPVVERDEDDALAVVRGPHNIVRRVVEFACDHPGIDIYLGSPTEILATMYDQARQDLDTAELAFCDDHSDLPVWQRPAASSGATDLVDTAASIGIAISERTAHRALGGGLAALDTVLAQVTTDDEPSAEPQVDIYRDRRSVKIHHADLDEFKRELLDAFDTLSERYYLNLKGEPKVTVAKDEIRVRFQIEKED